MMMASIYQLLHDLFYICQFSCAALALKHRFAVLNNYLETCTPQGINDKNVSTTQKSLDLRLFTELYNKLCDTLRIVNSAFASQLIIVMTIFMTIEIFGGYGVIREIITPSRNYTNMISSFIWISSHYPIKFFMAYSGKSTTEEAEKSLELISKMVATADERNVQQKIALHILLHQLQVREKRLSNIFFNIDYKVILVARKL